MERGEREAGSSAQTKGEWGQTRPLHGKKRLFFIGLLLVSLAVAERDVAALQGLVRSGGV